MTSTYDYCDKCKHKCIVSFDRVVAYAGSQNVDYGFCDFGIPDMLVKKIGLLDSQLLSNFKCSKFEEVKT